jgi:hypothetical protein
VLAWRPIAGTHHASMHRYRRAVDFNAAPGRKAAIVRWLAANNPGGTMTYASMGHIRMDTGPYHFVSLGAGARGASRHYAHVNKLMRVRHGSPWPVVARGLKKQRRPASAGSKGHRNEHPVGVSSAIRICCTSCS